MVPYPILTLPIQKRSFDSYCKSEKARLTAWGRRLSNEWAEREMSLERWPAWVFNDTIGFLEIGTGEGPNMLLGAIFLRRRCHPELKTRHAGISLPSLPSQRDQFLYWQEIGWRLINPSSSQTCIDAAEAMKREGQSCVRQFGRGCRQAVVIRPSFGFDGLNWPVAIANATGQTD